MPVLALLCCLTLTATPGDEPFQALHPHPRLLAHADDFERIKQLIATDELAQRWYAALKEQGEKMLAAPVAVHELRDGQRLLYVSREVEDRAMTLALLHRLEPDERYVARVWADMEAVAAFPDWNPDHFLDVAEMALGVALAYDWLHDAWTDAQRATMLHALKQHAIQPALDAHERGVWWTTTDINWNQVCHGGLIGAALCVADEDHDLAARMLDRAVAALPASMQRYAPDGGYPEGPGYWDYGTSFNVYAIAMLESALGHDFGLGAAPGFDVTGSFPIQMTGPTGRVFNFADANESPLRAPALFYLARRYGHPTYARYAAEHDRGHVLDLLWYDPALLNGEDALPTHALYESVGVAALRTAWDDPDAACAFVKAGRNGVAHGQLDLGSFVYEARGVRWFIDLGRDDYNLPGYFSAGVDGKRWAYYRNRAEGHNTLVIDPDDGLDQPLNARAPITLADDIATVDLTQACGRPVTRTVTLDGDTLRITDTIAGDVPANIYWFAHTRARIVLDEEGNGATLTQDGKRLRVKLVEPAGASFSYTIAQPLPSSPHPEGQNPNNGATLQNKSAGAFVRRGELPVYGEPDPSQAIRKLVIHRPDTTSTTITVTASPMDD